MEQIRDIIQYLGPHGCLLIWHGHFLFYHRAEILLEARNKLQKGQEKVRYALRHIVLRKIVPAMLFIITVVAAEYKTELSEDGIPENDPAADPHECLGSTV